MVFGGLVIAGMMIGVSILHTLLLNLVLCYLHTQLPTIDTFEPFFRNWFIKDYWPKMSQKMQREFQERSENQTNLLDSLVSSFKGWAMRKTEKLQSQALYEFVVKYSLPPVYTDWYFMRTARLNLGSRDRPAYLTFWGMHGAWMLAPYIVMDVQNTSLLDELQREATRAQGR